MQEISILSDSTNVIGLSQWLTEPITEGLEIRNGDSISVLDASSKQIYGIFQEKKQIPLSETVR